MELLLGYATSGDELWSVTVVRTEVLAGMRRGEERATHRLLDQLRWQDVTCEVADRAGVLARAYARSHSGIDTIDYLLAAAAELDALRGIHSVLDDRQRSQVADLLDRGLGWWRGGWGPYR